MTNSNIFLSVIIPAYNEEKNFKKGVLREVDDYLRKQPYSWEVLVVDDGSKDKTVFFVNRFIRGKKHWSLIKNPHQGKSQTVIKGLQEARGENRLFTDFDQSTPINEVAKLLAQIGKADLVIGSREIKGAKREAEPWYRHLMGKVFNFFVQLFLSYGIHDTQCGFKLLKKTVFEGISPKIKIGRTKAATAYTGAFDAEIIFLAKKLGFKVIEIPVFWKHVKTTRVSPFKDSLKMFQEIVKIRLYDFLGAYD